MELRKIRPEEITSLSGDTPKTEEQYRGFSINRMSTAYLFVGIHTTDGSETPKELSGLYTSWEKARDAIDYYEERIAKDKSN